MNTRINMPRPASGSVPGAGTNAYAVDDVPAAVRNGVHVVSGVNTLNRDTDACDTGPEPPVAVDGTKSVTGDEPVPVSGGTEEVLPLEVDTGTCSGTTTDEPAGNDDNICRVLLVSTTPSRCTRLGPLSVEAPTSVAAFIEAGAEPTPAPISTAAAAVVTTAPAAAPVRTALPADFDTRDAL